MRPVVLGRMAARSDHSIRPGEPLSVAAWLIRTEGRKHFTGTAIVDAGGAVRAHALATWIEPRTRKFERGT